MPDMKRWLSTPRASDSNGQAEEQRHPEDEEQSLFCESLLGLMQRTGRFEYLDYDGTRSKQEEKNMQAVDKEKENDPRRSLKRFSWSR